MIIRNSFLALATLFIISISSLAGTYNVSQNITGGNGTITSPWVGWESGVNGCPNNSRIYFSAGYYKQDTTITTKKYWIIEGDGKGTSIIRSTFNGDAFKSINTVNSATTVRLSIRDLSIQNVSTSNLQTEPVTSGHENPSNTGAGFVDVGGSFIDLQNVRVFGFKFGIIFNQTEVSHINMCTLDFQTNGGGGIWLVRGGEDTHAPTAQNEDWTNQITITKCQINEYGVAGIIDDGGTNHIISMNNFNGGKHFIYIAGTNNSKISDNAMEGSTDTGIVTDYRGYFDQNIGKGPNYQLTIDNNTIIPGAGLTGISNGYYQILTNNFIGTSGSCITCLSGIGGPRVMLGNSNYDTASFTSTCNPNNNSSYIILNLFDTEVKMKKLNVNGTIIQ